MKGVSKMKIETSFVINRPLEEVFAFTANLENQLKWQARLIEAKKTSEGPIGVGTIWRTVAKLFGQRIEAEMEVTEYEPNWTYAGQSTSGPFPIKVRQTYERVEEGTRINVTSEFEPGGFFKLAEPLLVSMLKRQGAADLANLKELMEAGAL